MEPQTLEGDFKKIGVYRTKIEHVIANQRARWCGNPPDLPVSQNRPGSSINAEKKRELFYYSILKIRGIATPVCALARNDMLLFGFAMTASFSARQIPICRAVTVITELLPVP